MRGIRLAMVVASITVAGTVHAANKPIDVYSIWYQVDTGIKIPVEQFEQCLTQDSIFGGGWSYQWGVGPITMHSAIVLTTPPPGLRVGDTLEKEINAAILSGTVPPPTADNNTVYLMHGPSTVSNFDHNGLELCHNSPYCAEHGPGQVATADGGAAGHAYQAALIPNDCPCNGTNAPLSNATFLTEHELGESIADEGTATFEVADACEQHPDQLECCGTLYDIQWLDRSGGPGLCEAIPATGPKCACGVVGFSCSDPSTCCSGACDTWIASADAGVTTACCIDTNQPCAAPNDCCGALTCTNGQCACRATGEPCARASDCCDTTNVCDPSSNVCTAAPVDAGAGDDETSGADSGCGCRVTGARRDRVGWLAIACALAAICSRRSRPSQRITQTITGRNNQCGRDPNPPRRNRCKSECPHPRDTRS